MNSEWSEYAPPGYTSGDAGDYPEAIQIDAAIKLQAAQGWGAWPNTAWRCGA